MAPMKECVAHVEDIELKPFVLVKEGVVSSEGTIN